MCDHQGTGQSDRGRRRGRDRERGDERRRSEERAERKERRRRARKERVLHTRISEDLAEDIRRMADELRVPVSNIVRTVLEEAFSVVETVTDNVGDLIEEVVDEAEAARERIRRQSRRRRRRGGWSTWVDEDLAREAAREADEAEVAGEPPPAAGAPEQEILGWQPLVLARAQPCGDCGRVLEKGTNAYAALTARGLGGGYRCESCLQRDAGASS